MRSKQSLCQEKQGLERWQSVSHSQFSFVARLCQVEESVQCRSSFWGTVPDDVDGEAKLFSSFMVNVFFCVMPSIFLHLKFAFACSEKQSSAVSFRLWLLLCDILLIKTIYLDLLFQIANMLFEHRMLNRNHLPLQAREFSFQIHQLLLQTCTDCLRRKAELHTVMDLHPVHSKWAGALSVIQI